MSKEKIAQLKIKNRVYCKEPPSSFGDTKKIRLSLSQEQYVRRKESRTKEFEKNRENDVSSCSVTPQNDKFRTKSSEWKEKRMKKKKAQESKKKPPFIVGIVRHHIYSPTLIVKNLTPKRKKKSIIQEHKNSHVIKGITKATEKRLQAKMAKAEIKQKPPKPPTTTKNDKIKINKSFAPPNYKFNPPVGLPKISLLALSSAHMISGSSSLSDKILTIRNDITENPDVPMEETNNIYVMGYFKRLMYEEKNRLQKLCEKWTEIQSQINNIEDIYYRINQAVEQTTMLIKDKFKQFYDLIQDCERKDGDVLVTCMDLHGFWDMMYLEVKNCDSQFAKLEELCARCWQEDQSFFVKSTGTKKKTVTKKKITVNQNLPKEMAEIQDNEKNLPQIINMNNERITPCITNKKVVNVSEKSFNVSCNKDLKVSTNYVYTSTPFSADTKSNISNISNELSTPFTMKVSQLYNKATYKFQSINSEQTFRKNSVETLEKSRRKSLRVKLARKADLDNHLTMTKSSDEKLKINQNSKDSLKQINKSELSSINSIHAEENSNSGSDNFNQTVIEKPISERKRTLKNIPFLYSLLKTPAEHKKSVKKCLPNKILETNFGRSSSSIVNKIVKNPCGISENSLSTPNTSLFHIVRNIDFKTPSTDRSKKHNSSIKRSWNRVIISDSTSKISRKMETTFSNKNTN